jgi:integrase/recombinase XerD
MITIKFYLNKQRASGNMSPVYIALRDHEGNVERFTTKLWVPTVKWVGTKGCVSGSGPEIYEMNQVLFDTSSRLRQIEKDLNYSRKTISAKAIKSIFAGKTDLPKTIGDFIKLYLAEAENSYMSGKIGYVTIEKNKLYCENILAYCQHDILITDISHGWLLNFESYGLHTKKWSVNYLAKHTALINSLFEDGIIRGYIKPEQNPFSSFKISYDHNSEFKYLTIEELKLIEECEGPARDLFVLCCYTGLAYSDVVRLSNDWITTDLRTGRKVIINPRQKTNVEFTIPLIKPVEIILEKYSQNLDSKIILPILSLQRYNLELKGLAKISGVQKCISSHVARHTAATLFLRFGMPAETVSKVLGLSLRVLLSVYGAIVKDKIVDDMIQVEFKLMNYK